MIKVGVVGALGKMGKEVVKAVLGAEDTTLVMAVDIFSEGEDIGSIVTGKECGVKIETNLENAIKNSGVEVVVDFTQPSQIYSNVCKYMECKVKSVIGTTGLSETQIAEIKKMSEDNKTSCLIAPNFSTGAVLLMMFAKQAAKYFNNAEIIELHHNQNNDAPSGPAI